MFKILLKPHFNKISSYKIKRLLKNYGYSNKIICFRKINSTNTYAKKIATNGIAHGTVVVANTQTAGRGRMGREFFSPSNTGIYMSLIIRSEKISLNPELLTIGACVATCRTIEKYTKKIPSIKWVNDIFLNGKKVCGILTEAISVSNLNKINYFIVGIGLNVSTSIDAFPDEIRSIAGSIKVNNISRNIIIADIIKELMQICNSTDETAIINEYKSRSIIIGKNISFTKDGKVFSGIASDINNQGNLIVSLKTGEEITLVSGEVSLGSSLFSE